LANVAGVLLGSMQYARAMSHEQAAVRRKARPSLVPRTACTGPNSLYVSNDPLELVGRTGATGNVVSIASPEEAYVSGERQTMS
jgi:hypothetical protein